MKNKKAKDFYTVVSALAQFVEKADKKADKEKQLTKKLDKIGQKS